VRLQLFYDRHMRKSSNMNPRASPTRYQTNCRGFPIPSRETLRVPKVFDYRVLRSMAPKVLAWIIEELTSSQPIVGPQFRYLERGSRGRAQAQMFSPNGEEEITDSDMRQLQMLHFVSGIFRSSTPSDRIGVVTLRYKRTQSSTGHRFILLCDGREGSVLNVHIVDPNENLATDLVDGVKRMLQNFFNLQNIRTVDVFILPVDRFNVSASPVTEALDKQFKLETQVDPGAYCVTASMLLIVDFLCTKERIFSNGHLSRLAADLSRGATDEVSATYNRLMAMRSFTFELLMLMKKRNMDVPAFETEYVRFTPRVEYDVPKRSLPPPPPDEGYLESMTKPMLKRMCEAYGVDPSGTKEELVQRIRQTTV